MHKVIEVPSIFPQPPKKGEPRRSRLIHIFHKYFLSAIIPQNTRYSRETMTCISLSAAAAVFSPNPLLNDGSSIVQFLELSSRTVSQGRVKPTKFTCRLKETQDRERAKGGGRSARGGEKRRRKSRITRVCEQTLGLRRGNAPNLNCTL